MDNKRKKRLIFLFLLVKLILLVPLIAMQFTTEVKWKIIDFIIAGGLLFSTGLLFEFLVRKISSTKYKIAVSTLLLLLLFLIWLELSVGIFGTCIAGS